MRGVFLDTGTLGNGDISLDAIAGTLDEWSFRERTAAKEVEAALRDAAVVVSNKVLLDERLLASAANLQLVCIAATGTNNVDLAAAAKLGIAVCNARSYATTSVVEHVFSQVLCLTRRLNEYRQAVHDGRWQQAGNFCLLDFPIRELSGQTLGIIGRGELGKAVGSMAAAFGLHVRYAQRPGSAPSDDRTPLDELLQTADIISLHCPLTPETKNLIGTREIGLMKPGALLVNTARGGIVDEQALADALQAGRIAGAAIDVLETEPPAGDNPLLALDLPNLLVTPHIAWAGIAARQALVDDVAKNIHCFLAGKPRNLVTEKNQKT